jgi:hypothetical protein
MLAVLALCSLRSQAGWLHRHVGTNIKLKLASCKRSSTQLNSVSLVRLVTLLCSGSRHLRVCQFHLRVPCPHTMLSFLLMIMMDTDVPPRFALALRHGMSRRPAIAGGSASVFRATSTSSESEWPGALTLNSKSPEIKLFFFNPAVGVESGSGNSTQHRDGR